MQSRCERKTQPTRVTRRARRLLILLNSSSLPSRQCITVTLVCDRNLNTTLSLSWRPARIPRGLWLNTYCHAHLNTFPVSNCIWSDRQFTGYGDIHDVQHRHAHTIFSYADDVHADHSGTCSLRRQPPQRRKLNDLGKCARARENAPHAARQLTLSGSSASWHRSMRCDAATASGSVALRGALRLRQGNAGSPAPSRTPRSRNTPAAPSCGSAVC